MKDLETTEVDFEILIVANDPTEKEKTVLDKLKKYENVVVLEVPRESIYASWNRGIAHSTGEVIGFINVDDIRFAKSIADGIEHIKQGADFVYFPFMYKRYVRIFNILFPVKIKKFYPPTPDVARTIQGMPYGPFWLISKKFLDSAGMFDESFTVAGDYEWSMRTNTKGTYVQSNVIAGVFTSDGKTLSGSRSKIQQEECERIRKQYPRG
jgi:glycosyltransferase involved in cell wall biosynthesis